MPKETPVIRPKNLCGGRKYSKKQVQFETIADISITQTLARSLNTSFTVVFVLLALLLFGGESIKWFVVALLIGVISGTYSSIFNATALGLVGRKIGSLVIK